MGYLWVNKEPEVFKAAEEAYSAVKLNNGPKLIQSIVSVSAPILAVILLFFFVTIGINVTT